MFASLELRAPLLNASEPAPAKQMVGGGLFSDSTMFGTVANNVLYLKADHENRSELEDTVGDLVTYRHGGKVLVLSYFEVPPELLNDTDKLCRRAMCAREAEWKSANARPNRNKRK